MFILNTNRRKKIQLRVRARIKGTDARPRLSVFKSNKHVYAQIINDDQAITLAAASSLSAHLKNDLKGKSPSERAVVVGKHIAEIAKDKGIDTVVFDRNGYRYHGIVKALADAAREAGLVF